MALMRMDHEGAATRGQGATARHGRTVGGRAPVCTGQRQRDLSPQARNRRLGAMTGQHACRPASQPEFATMKHSAIRCTLAALALSATALSALPANAADNKDLPPLREVSSIDDNMLWVGIAYEIGEKCPTIDPRTAKGLLFLNKLRIRAEEMGYSYAQIKAYVDSRAEKDRIRALGESYMKSQGLDPEKVADLCTLGMHEIDRGSQIGVLLRAK